MPEQKERLESFCKFKGYEIIDYYTDAGISAKTGNHRPEFERLKSDIKAKKINTIVALKLARITRSIFDWEKLITFLDENNAYIDCANDEINTTKPMILGNVLGSVRFSNYLPEEEVGEIIMRLRQYYDVHYTEATYYVDKQMFYFNFAEDNSAIVRVFLLEDYYKLDLDNKMETYKFGILYINEEDKFQMKEIDTAFDYIPDETNDSVIYTKELIPISVGVKPVKFCKEKAE